MPAISEQRIRGTGADFHDQVIYCEQNKTEQKTEDRHEEDIPRVKVREAKNMD